MRDGAWWSSFVQFSAGDPRSIERVREIHLDSDVHWQCSNDPSNREFGDTAPRCVKCGVPFYDGLLTWHIRCISCQRPEDYFNPKD